MKDNSTMERNEYLFETIWTGMVTMIWFRKLLFQCLPDMTYVQSKRALRRMLYKVTPKNVTVQTS